MIDALGSSGDYAFRDQWAPLQLELAPARSPQEREAVGRVAALDALASYLDAAEMLVGTDLTLLEPAEISEISAEKRGSLHRSGGRWSRRR